MELFSLTNWKKKEKINEEHYDSLLQQLNDKVTEKSLHLVRKKMLYHQDNAPTHKYAIAMVEILEL